jgi:cellulose biosynthesis protein BcsQ
MSIRFDDSLPTLIRVISQTLGDNALSSGIVLRDVTGKLAFFSTDELNRSDAEALSGKLQDELGPYGRPDRILANRSDFGVEQILNDPTVFKLTVEGHPIRLIDRRLVGADWLRRPTDVAPPPPRLVFASLKGGVGRSTALAVVAGDLASRGYRVLALDLDVEAPGLGPMLLQEDTLPEFGILDALVENGISGLDETFLADMIGPSALAKGQGQIDVVPVLGKRSLKNPADVLTKIARAYMEDITDDGKINTFVDQVRSLIDDFAATKRYDVILVDARAGLHETTAAAIMGLGAEVYIFGRDEMQTFQGFRVLLAHLSRFVDPAKPSPEWLSRLTLVQGQAPQEVDKRLTFADKCQSIISEVGLGPKQVANLQTSSSTDSFANIPWNDDIPDEEVLPADDFRIRGPVAVLDDPRFRGFDPLIRRDLLSEQLYQSSFGPLLEQVYNCLLL